MVSKTVSISLKDIVKIQKKIDDGEILSLSEFVQIAIKKQLKDD